MKSHLLKLLCFSVIFLFVFNISYVNSKTKDNQYKNYPRLDMVIPNLAVIRFKQENSKPGKIDKVLKNNCAYIIEPILNLKETISYRMLNGNFNTTMSNQQIQEITKAEEPLLRSYFIRFDENIPPEKFCYDLLKNNPEIEIAEPYYKNQLLFTPNDYYVSAQNLLEVINAYKAWDEFQGDSSVVIAISDNGVFREHNDLVNSVAPNWGEIPENDIDDDGNGYIDDFLGYNFSYIEDNVGADNTYHSDDHGTGVAGIACATTNNSIGIAGVGFSCRLFPIKTAKKKETDITYGYQSIKYAAIRGCKVINCSWGLDKNYSDIDQSIINFALAYDLAIVAAGGNGYNTTTPWYPANYHGVLGVGEVNLSDIVTGSTSMGSHIRVMAPGEGNWTLNNYNNYAPISGGTSYSAPVVSGFVGFIRSKYPYLNAMQSLEFARQCVDDIKDLNSYWRNVIPGRINMVKALEIDPFSIPSIRPIKATFKNSEGNFIERFIVNDTVTMSITVHNYLGNSGQLRFSLSNASTPEDLVIITDSLVIIDNIGQDSDAEIATFKFVITQKHKMRMFFRVDIKGENNYSDFFLLPFIPTSEVTTFENEVIKFSVTDRGKIGYGGIDGNMEGVGFVYKDYGNQLYEAGLMATENNQRVVSTCYGSGPENNDFDVIKPFFYPEIKKGIAIDSNEDRKSVV